MAKNKTDVLVIGGGVVGICAAHYLSQLGRKVTVLEKADRVCAGASYGNAGLIVPSHSVPLAATGMVGKGLKWMFNPESPFYIKPRLSLELLSWLWSFNRACNKERMRRSMRVIRELSMASMQLYEELSADERLDFGFTQRGMIMVARSEKGFSELLEEARLLRECGTSVEQLGPTEAQQMLGKTRVDIVGGLYFSEDAHIVPDRFVRGLADCIQQEVQVCTSTEVLGFVTNNGEINAVHTTRGEYTANQVVLASGAWSAGIGRLVPMRLPIQPAKGYSVTFKMPERGPDIPCMLAESKVGVTPMGNMLRFAGTLELAGMDLSISQRRVQAILRAVPLYLPDLDFERLELIEIWRGLRPCTPDGLPFLGRSKRFKNLTVAAGHAMIGVSLGPITGKLVAEIVTGEEPSVDVGALEPERFG